LVKVIRGANAPLLEKTIREQLDIEKSGGTHKPVLLEAGSEIINPLPESKSIRSLVEATREEGVKASADSLQPSIAESASPTGKETETFALILPDAMKPAVIEAIMEKIRAGRFAVVQKKKVWLTPASVRELCPDLVDRPSFNSMVTYYTSGPCMGLVLSKLNAVEEWKTLIGPANPNHAKESAPTRYHTFL
jgi:nucleoside diphosphate kinase